MLCYITLPEKQLFSVEGYDHGFLHFFIVKRLNLFANKLIFHVLLKITPGFNPTKPALNTYCSFVLFYPVPFSLSKET